MTLRMGRPLLAVWPFMDDDWLSVQEAADRCGMAYRTLLATVQQGKLPAEKPDGKPYRIRRADVDAFIEQSRVKPGQLLSVLPRIPPCGQAGR